MMLQLPYYYVNETSKMQIIDTLARFCQSTEEFGNTFPLFKLQITYLAMMLLIDPLFSFNVMLNPLYFRNGYNSLI